MTAYYTPNDGFTANNVSFYKSNILHHDFQLPVSMHVAQTVRTYMLQCLSSYSGCYKYMCDNIKINKK